MGNPRRYRKAICRRKAANIAASMAAAMFSARRASHEPMARKDEFMKAVPFMRRC
jgi:hypothetical protein